MQPDAAAAKTVNLTELALIIANLTNTLRDVIRQHPEFRVLSSGSNGVAYEFDAVACAERWEHHAAEVE